MGLSGSKSSCTPETVHSCKVASESSTGSREGKFSGAGTEFEEHEEEESFYSWSASVTDPGKGVQGNILGVATLSSLKVPHGGQERVDSLSSDGDGPSSFASTVDMETKEDNIDKLGKRLEDQLHVEDASWSGQQEYLGHGGGEKPPKAPGTMTPAESPANQSWETQRTSHAGSDGSQYPMRMSTGTSSARSSFALDRADVVANRKSLEAFQKAYCQQKQSVEFMSLGNDEVICEKDANEPDTTDFLKEHIKAVESLMRMGVPREVCKEALMLSILPPETPAPLSMLSKLWNEDISVAESRLLSLAKLGVLKVAHLPDGNIWGLPQSDFIRELHSCLTQDTCVQSFHRVLVDGYARGAWEHRAFQKESNEMPKSFIGDEKLLLSLLTVDNIPDDGYFVTNLVYHLVGARLNNVVRELLLNPDWMERKLFSAGAAAVISDFRRYLMMFKDPDIKLVLEALQLSVGVLKNNFIPGLLKSQLAGRLMMAPISSRRPWMTRTKSSNTHIKANGVVSLPILNPCLDQAGGLQRLCLKGHRGPVKHAALLSTGIEAVSASTDGTICVWDLEIGDCIMTIPAHDGPITGMGMTSDMSLVVTSSEDGMVRAFDLEAGNCLRTFGNDNCAVEHLLLDPFGRFLVTGDAKSKICLWDLVTAKVVHESTVGSQITFMELSPCTKFAVIGTICGAIYAVDIETWQLVCSFNGHSASITGVSVGHHLNTVISSSLDGEMRVWKRDGKCKLKVSHGNSIISLYVTKSLEKAICGYDDGKALVWDLKNGNCLKVLDGHNGPITCISMSYKGDLIMTGSVDGTAIVWSYDSGEIMRVLEGHSSSILCMEMSKKGRFALTGSEDGSLRVWDFTAVNSHIPHWHAGTIRALCTAAEGIAVTAGDDCVASIWDSSVGEFLGEIRRHSVSIRWCFASNDGSRILTASPNREVHVWDIKTREYLHGLSSSPGSRMKSISASADLDLAVICLFDSTVSLWNLISGECLWEIQKRGQRSGSLGHRSAVNDVILTQDGKYVITASKDTTTRIWDVQNKTCLHVLKGHEDSVVGLKFEPHRGTLLTYALDHSLIAWDFLTGDKLSRAKFKKPITRAAISRNGKIVAALSDGNINVISKDTDIVKEIRMHTGDVSDLLFSEDGDYLFSSSSDCSLKMVDLVNECVRGVFIGDCPITSIAIQRGTCHLIAGTDRGVVIFLDLSGLLPV